MTPNPRENRSSPGIVLSQHFPISCNFPLKHLGYAGGLDKKVKLLELEKAQPISGKVSQR